MKQKDLSDNSDIYLRFSKIGTLHMTCNIVPKLVKGNY